MRTAEEGIEPLNSSAGSALTFRKETAGTARHGIDYCKECKGEFGRNFAPSLFFEELYIRERAEYDRLEEDLDFGTGLYYLEEIPRTCFGSPVHVSFGERDAAFARQIEGCRDRALVELKRRKDEGGHTPLDRHGQPHQIEGGQTPLELETGGRYSERNLLDGLRPVDRDIRLRGWFDDLPSEYRQLLGHVLHHGIDRDL